MDCTRNRFCILLPENTRAKLCAHCRRSFFKAKSIQTRQDYLRNCMLVLDGTFISSTQLGVDAIDHETNLPVLYMALPGRLLNLDVTFGFTDLHKNFEYVDFNYFTDTWVASFSHQTIQDLFDSDPDFRHAVMKNMIELETDVCRMAAMLRSNYTYYGLLHLTEMLANHNQYFTQQQLAEIMNHDRTSICKAIARIKKEHPEKWQAYISNKGRMPSKPIPGEGQQ